MATLSKLREDSTGVIYANPAKPDQIVRFRNTTSQKTLSGVPVTNYLTEIIYNEDNEITVATGVTAKDAISLRIRVSGAALSMTQLSVLIHSMADQIQTWAGQNVFTGFAPSTAPVIPAAS